VLIAVVALLAISSIAISANTNAANSGNEKVLFDMGNGNTLWSDVSTIGTIDEVLGKAASDCGLVYSSSGNIITVNGVADSTIGGAASTTKGSFSASGTTGVMVTARWVPFEWDSGSGEWRQITDIYAPYAGGSLALGFYADGQVPSETPDYQSSWTMVRGDAQQTGVQDTAIPNSQAETRWLRPDPSDQSGNQTVYGGVDAGVLSVQGFVFVKYNATTYSPGTTSAYSTMVCYTMNGDWVWGFTYPSVINYDLSTPAIIGDYIYVPSSFGNIFKIPLTGPGDNNEYVTAIGNQPYSADMMNSHGPIPRVGNTPLTGTTMFDNGPGSLVYDSGVIYCSSCNGMVYCFDLDLNLIWSRQMGGEAYFFSPTVYDNYIFMGALNGSLYVMNKVNGNIIDQASVYTRTITSNGIQYQFGSVQQVVVFEDNGNYILMFGVSDGMGLSSTVGGIGIYNFDGNKLSKRQLAGDQPGQPSGLITNQFGLVSNYVLQVNTKGFEGVYFTSQKGLFTMDINGNYEQINEGFTSVRAPMVLVNGNSIYIQGYALNDPISILSFDGTIVKAYAPGETVQDYSMAPPLVIDGWVFSGNDSGLNAIYGVFPAYGGTGAPEKPLIYTVAIIIAVILLILVVVYVLIRFIKKEDKPFNYISRSIKHYLGGEELKHNKRSKHRLLVVMIIGISVSVAIFIASLCIGYNAIMSPGEMFSALFSAIAHGGADPSNINQVRVFESRLPRTLAALAVGIGLSVAGSMYQAIIRNPLVDPYIMGVSSGAGTAAIAVIAFNFTFFGLFAPHSIYATALTAMIGGLIAFAITMFIAERAGGTSINYVLAGVVVGLAFSSVQTLMLSMAGHSVSNALAWLFGSFANVSWNQVWLILIPGIAMSLVPLVWAKEFNLVLLGEDQAQQMGLNVRRFNRLMLILASVLTSLCVAFVGIIGFVGLVIPHLCRMMLGGDHRLVLPTSIAFGGALMMFADLAARTLYLGLELPVGAITTIIGVPVFAYLLIRRGKMYEG